MKIIPCPKCKGAGSILDPSVVGAQMRQQRSRAGVSMREIARSLNLTAPYLSDLERGKRSWTRELITKYKTALRACVAASHNQKNEPTK